MDESAGPPPRKDGERSWQCADGSWRWGARHRTREAAQAHIRSMGRAGRGWTVIPWEPLTRNPDYG